MKWYPKALIFFLAIYILSGCGNKDSKKGFVEYYSSLHDKQSGTFSNEKLRVLELNSDLFKIDTIYRSMKGPISEKEIFLADSGDIIWLTGYNVKVFDSLNNALPLDFICHNNLNLADSRNFPWHPGNWNYYNRVFTLTQGITNINLPDGFGIPLPAEQALRVVFQALNHNLPNLDTILYQQVEIKYFKDSEIDFKLKPLYHHNIWLVKQYSGPKGKFGTPVPEDYKIEDSTQIIYTDAQQPSCGIDELANNQALFLDYFWDNKGRKYTGHWKVPPGEEYLEFDATLLLNFNKENLKVHYFNAHIHPFCEYLEMYDQTADEVIYKATVENKQDKTGIAKISELTSEEGITLYTDHKYLLRSKYNNTTEDTLSAMSVIYLFMGYN